jgi:predicted RNase H-like HicB family nuclease/predicted RNA binding protein YcfA (HicA-like mRNA interferase family)
LKVREAIRLIEEDGWVLVATRGSHRQFKHPLKPGRVTVAGKPSDDLASGMFKSILQQYLEAGRTEGPPLMRYAVVIEKAEGNYSAYVPDLPGCVAAGSSVADVEREIRDAIRFHIEGLREDGLPVPAPTSMAEYVEA